MNTIEMTPTTKLRCPVKIESSWEKALGSELNLPYIAELSTFVSSERAGIVPVYPPKDLVFNAFEKTPFDRVKVVIVGQDPYHGPGQAHGLSFSVPHGIPLPPSLRNIFIELQSDLGIATPSHGCLTSWAEQGVLLLNATLTVRQGQPMSHHGRGWERFTDAAVKALYGRREPVIFVLWGKSAQEKCRFLMESGASTPHLILTAPHPSPFSAHSGFFGCGHFSKINAFLVNNGSSPISWAL